MKRFVAVASSTSGAVYLVDAPDAETAYRIVGRDFLGMDYAALDTGDVDVDLYEVPEPCDASGAVELKAVE